MAPAEFPDRLICGCHSGPRPGARGPGLPSDRSSRDVPSRRWGHGCGSCLAVVTSGGREPQRCGFSWLRKSGTARGLGACGVGSTSPGQDSGLWPFARCARRVRSSRFLAQGGQLLSTAMGLPPASQRWPNMRGVGCVGGPRGWECLPVRRCGKCATGVGRQRWYSPGTLAWPLGPPAQTPLACHRVADRAAGAGYGCGGLASGAPFCQPIR